MSIFAQRKLRQYQDHADAIKIVKELESVDKMKQSESFVRFVLKATDITL